MNPWLSSLCYGIAGLMLIVLLRLLRDLIWVPGA